mgnify:CR=1 FL=1
MKLKLDKYILTTDFMLAAGGMTTTVIALSIAPAPAGWIIAAAVATFVTAAIVFASRQRAKDFTQLSTSMATQNQQSEDKLEQIKQEHTQLNCKWHLLQRQKHNAEAIIYSIRDAVIVSVL